MSQASSFANGGTIAHLLEDPTRGKNLSNLQGSRTEKQPQQQGAHAKETRSQEDAAMILSNRRKVDLRCSGAAAHAVQRNVVARTVAATASRRAQTRRAQRCSTLPGPALVFLCSGLALTALLALVALASSAPDQQQQQQDALIDLAAAASNNYDNQQQQQQQQASGGSKAKKIQIVYIKVPLAKLRPSLAGQWAPADYNGSASSSNYSTGAKTEQQYETTDFKSATGSQASSGGSGADEQQQLSSGDIAAIEQQHEQTAASRQPQSFLIPMALVQTSSDSNENASPGLQQQQQQHEPGYQSQLSSAGSQLYAAHAGPTDNEPLSPAQMYRQLAAQKPSIAHGFMSSFLLGEKEKMATAAMRLQNQLAQSDAQLLGALASQQQQQLALAAPLATATATNAQQQPSLNLHHLQNPKGPGGLMPPIMVPYSRMPDNAIGQAYGAAVGTALPAESGSPSSLLSSSSTSSLYASSSNNNNNNYGNGNSYKAKQGTNSTGAGQYANGNGGASGTAGTDAYSPGTGSGGSYGGAPLGHSGAGSSANTYQSSMRDSDASGASSGYGSGTSTSGASGAFSDYPRVPSPASSNSLPQGPYAQQATLINVGSHDSQQQQQQLSAHDSYSAARLKQAKKTIIPIVVQVEHAILDQAQAAQNANYMNGAGGQKGSNKYGAGGRGHRQLGGKRGTRHGKDNNNAKSNQIYGAATNSVAHFGDIPPGAQFINAANMHDINQITAQINAENAASAAAALAQADASFGPSMPAVYGNSGAASQAMPGNQARRPQPSAGNQAAPGSQYLQSAASALLANTHPVIQAAASGGLASVSKLGAKLGEIIALPSMQVPNSIAHIGSSLPSAFSSLTNSMGSQLAQSMQNVAKEHPMASSFARQIAQQAGIQLPAQFFMGQPSQAAPNVVGQMHPAAGAGGQQQIAVAASNQQPQQAMASPQMLQNLKLSIGQNLQSAASQLMGMNQKASAFAHQAGLLNGVGGTAGQVAAFSAALKQLGSVSPVAAQLANQLASVSKSMNTAASSTQPQAVAAPPSMLAPGAAAGQQQASPVSNLMEQLVSAAAANAPIQLPANIQQQMLSHFLQQQQQQQQLAGPASGPQSVSDTGSLEPNAKPAKTGLKSKFLSFFQPPKFISNLLSWSDRADDRNDEGVMAEMSKLLEAASGINATTTTTSTATSTSTTSTTKTAEINKGTSVAPTTIVTSAGGQSTAKSTSTTAAQTTSTTQASTPSPSVTQTQSITSMSVTTKEVPKTAQYNSTTTGASGKQNKTKA